MKCVLKYLKLFKFLGNSNSLRKNSFKFILLIVKDSLYLTPKSLRSSRSNIYFSLLSNSIPNTKSQSGHIDFIWLIFLKDSLPVKMKLRFFLLIIKISLTLSYHRILFKELMHEFKLLKVAIIIFYF